MTLRTISYGGGVQSTALVILAALRDPRLEEAMGGPIDAAIMANVGDDSEHPATLRFVREVVIPWAAAHDFEVAEIDRVKRDGSVETLYGRLMKEGSRSLPIPVRMSNGAPGNRSCTADFKIKVIAKWLKDHGATADDPALVAIGISTDEVQRIGNKRNAPHEETRYPLIDLRMDRAACQRLNVKTLGVAAPKSSCWFCPFHRPQVWAEMRRDEPELFAQSVHLERTLNERRQAISCTTSGVPAFDIRQEWEWFAGLEDTVVADEPWPYDIGDVRYGQFYEVGSCPDCDHQPMRLAEGTVPDHRKDDVYLTRFARPLDEAITEAQTPLFTDATWSDPGEAGCDSGHCFT
jgi:hypothetical protein